MKDHGTLAELKLALTSKSRMDDYLEIESTENIILAIKSLVEESAGSETLRDKFAAKAMQALLSDSISISKIKEMATESGLEETEIVAKCAYQFSDGMLKAREAEGAK